MVQHIEVHRLGGMTSTSVGGLAILVKARSI